MTATIRPQDNKVQDLIPGGAQTITGSWVNLGPVIDCRDVSQILLWFKYTTGDAANARIRATARRTETDAEVFSLPIITPAAAVVGLEPEYYEFTTDQNTQVVLAFSTLDLIPFIQLQVQAGTAGTTGSVTMAQVSSQSASS